jgi:hypothetical protein
MLRVGTVLCTLLEASDFMLALPEDIQRHPAWQHAAELLVEAANSGRESDLELATLQVERALFLEGQLKVQD